MNTKTFLATLELSHGDTTHLIRYLVLANSKDSANQVAQDVCQGFFGEPEDAEWASRGWMNADERDQAIRPKDVTEIGLSTYLELNRLIPVRRSQQAEVPTIAHLEDDLSAAAKALTNGINRTHKEEAPEGAPVAHTAVLRGLAFSWGSTNWQALKAKVNGPSAQRLKALQEAARQVVLMADDEGCTEDLTVTSKEAVEALEDALDALLEAEPTPEAPAFTAAFREEVVASLVDDVTRRARAHQFHIFGPTQALDLANESNDILALGATQEELTEAARRLA